MLEEGNVHKYTFIVLSFYLFSLFIYGCNSTEKDWKQAESLNTVQSYSQFIENHKSSPYAETAKERIIELDWHTAKQKNNIEAYKLFTQKYPASKYVQECKVIIEQLVYTEATVKNTPQAYDEFIKSYPDSKFIKKAKLNKDIQEIVIPRIPLYFNYEGSSVIIMYNDGKIISLVNKSQKWILVKSEVEDLLHQEVSIIGNIKPGNKGPGGITGAGDKGALLAIKEKL